MRSYRDTWNKPLVIGAPHCWSTPPPEPHHHRQLHQVSIRPRRVTKWGRRGLLLLVTPSAQCLTAGSADAAGPPPRSSPWLSRGLVARMLGRMAQAAVPGLGLAGRTARGSQSTGRNAARWLIWNFQFYFPLLNFRKSSWTSKICIKFHKIQENAKQVFL
jgi:hypothetical protein